MSHAQFAKHGLRNFIVHVVIDNCKSIQLCDKLQSVCKRQYVSDSRGRICNVVKQFTLYNYDLFSL